MKYFVFLWHVVVITLALFLIRPVECLVKGLWCGIKSGVDSFWWKCTYVWSTYGGWEANTLYKEAYLKMKGEGSET